MHEWALAEGVIQAASGSVEERGLEKVTEVVVRIGELQQIEHEILQFALEQLRTPLMKDASSPWRPSRGNSSAGPLYKKGSGLP